MLGWLKNKVPGIAPNKKQQRMEKNEVIQKIEKLIANIDDIMNVSEKTNLLKEIQHIFPEENITHLHELTLEYYRELLINLIGFTKDEIKEITSKQ